MGEYEDDALEQGIEREENSEGTNGDDSDNDTNDEDELESIEQIQGSRLDHMHQCRLHNCSEHLAVEPQRVAKSKTVEGENGNEFSAGVHEHKEKKTVTRPKTKSKKNHW